MKKLSKVLSLVALLFSLSHSIFAHDLNYKSKELNQIVGIFNKFRPDLVKTGTIDVAYCGTFGGNFFLEKLSVKEFSSEYAISAKSYVSGIVDFIPLELNEDAEKDLTYSVDNIVGSTQNNLIAGQLLKTQNQDGVILNWELGGVGIYDRETKEVLIYGSTVWQDDCD